MKNYEDDDDTMRQKQFDLSSEFVAEMLVTQANPMEATNWLLERMVDVLYHAGIKSDSKFFQDYLMVNNKFIEGVLSQKEKITATKKSIS